MQSWRVSNHLAVLAADLRQRMRLNPLPPEQDETVLVQSRQLSDWLERRLSDDFGACAGIRWLLPSDILGWCGETAPENDPWSRDHLRWRLRRAVEHTASQHPMLAAAWNPTDAVACHRLLEQLADAFDTWQLQRPDLLADWADKRHHDPAPHGPWQAELWRELLADTPIPPRSTRLATAIAALRRGDPGILARTPQRLTAFAISNVPLPLLDLLEGYGRHRELTVDLWSPSPHPWVDLPSQRELAHRLKKHLALASLTPHAERQPQFERALRDDEAGHPLLSSLAGQARRWFRALGRDTIANAWDPLPFVEPDHDSDLHQVQSDMQELLDPRTRTVPATLRVDGSLTLHRCSSERRELEVFRDKLVEAFAENSDLTADQVLVLLPDVATYAPLIPAVFGCVLANGQRIPWRIIDRSMAASDPLAAGLLAVSGLIGSRVTRSNVLALLDLPTIRTALEVSQDDVDYLTLWLDGAGLHWGVDGAHRASVIGSSYRDVHAVGTWSFTLDRLCAGAWHGRSSGLGGDAELAVAGDLPGNLPLLARFVEWFAIVREVLEEPTKEAAPTIHYWSAWATEVIRVLLLPPDHHTDDADAIRAVIADVANYAKLSSEVVPPVVWKALLEQHMQVNGNVRPVGNPGGVTFAGLKPLRAIPATFIAILGLDDHAFPRSVTTPTWDLVASTEGRSGDRDPRQEDRQLFLEALFACGDRLHLSWVATCPRTGRDRAPSICVRDMVEAIDQTFAAIDGVSASQLVTSSQTLQPFSPGVQSTSDPLVVLQIQARLAVNREPQPLVINTHNVMNLSIVGDFTLDELFRTLMDPAKAYLRHGLGIDVFEESAASSDDELFEPGYLEQWNIRQALIRDGMLGRSDATACMIANGDVAPGALGLVTVATLASEANEQVRRIRAAGGGSDTIAISLSSSDTCSWRLHATLPAPGPKGVVIWTASGLAAKAHLRLWLTAVVWQAWCQTTKSGECPHVTLISRKKGKSSPVSAITTQLENAPAIVERLVRLAVRARHELLPLPVQASWKAAEEQQKKPDEPQPSYAVRQLCYGSDDPKKMTTPDLSGWTASAWRGHDVLADSRWLPLVDELWRGYPFTKAGG